MLGLDTVIHTDVLQGAARRFLTDVLDVEFVLGIALIGDSGTIHDTRGLDILFEHPKGVAGSGYSLEILAGALAVLTGLARLAFTREET